VHQALALMRTAGTVLEIRQKAPGGACRVALGCRTGALGCTPPNGVEELAVLAKQMVNINANQAGRNQGAGAAPSANGTTANPSILSAVTGGAN